MKSVMKRGYIQREYKIALETLEEIPEGEILLFLQDLKNVIFLIILAIYIIVICLKVEELKGC